MSRNLRHQRMRVFLFRRFRKNRIWLRCWRARLRHDMPFLPDLDGRRDLLVRKCSVLAKDQHLAKLRRQVLPRQPHPLGLVLPKRWRISTRLSWESCGMSGFCFCERSTVFGTELWVYSGRPGSRPTQCSKAINLRVASRWLQPAPGSALCPPWPREGHRAAHSCRSSRRVPVGLVTYMFAVSSGRSPQKPLLNGSSAPCFRRDPKENSFRVSTSIQARI
jgi:hypothetical protein